MSDALVCRINGFAKFGLCSAREVHKYVRRSLAPEKQIYNLMCRLLLLACSSSLDLLQGRIAGTKFPIIASDSQKCSYLFPLAG